MAEAIELEVAGRTIRVSNPQKLYFPEAGHTKLDLVQYYVTMADQVVNHLQERPTTLGDWGGGTGPLDVPEKTALELIDHVRSEDFDVAVSYRMPVDHGFVQMWEAVLGDFKSIPILPIFVNAAAPPIPTYRRARQLGKSVGRFAMRSGKRVLFAASGGLSHDPPLPAIKDAPPEIRERLINGRNPSPEAKEAREKRVLEAGVLAEAGKGPCKPLNPEWDREFMDILRSGEISAQTRSIPTRCERRRGAAPTRCSHGSPPLQRFRPEGVTPWSRNSTKPSPAGSPAWR